MSYIEVNGIQICCEEQGCGEAVVFVHGSMGRREVFARQAQALSKAYRCVLFDLRGHGESGGCEWDSSIHCEDILGLMEGLGIGKAHIVSHSMGSEISMLLAIRHPERIASLVTVSSAGMPNPFVRAFLEDMHSNIESPKYADYLARTAREQRVDGRELARLTLENCRNFGGYSDEELRRVTMPVLTVRGERDVMVTDEELARLDGLLPQHRTITVAGAGHMLHCSTRTADALSGILMDFLKSAV